jgi:Amt family ammonium transporter
VRLIHDGFSGIIAGRAVLNTLLGGAAGGLATLATLYKNGLGVDLGHINNGILSGLVSVTAGCATFHPWQAAIVASVAGPLYLGTSILLVKLRVDDVLNATSVHLSCGLWGALSAGLFPTLQSVRFVYQIESCGAFYSCNGGRQLANQLLYIFAILLWVGVTASTLFYTMKLANFLRESFDDEVHDAYTHTPMYI